MEELSDVTVIFDTGHFSERFFGLVGRPESSHCLFCKDMPELVSRLSDEN